MLHVIATHEVEDLKLENMFDAIAYSIACLHAAIELDEEGYSDLFLTKWKREAGARLMLCSYTKMASAHLRPCEISSLPDMHDAMELISKIKVSRRRSWNKPNLTNVVPDSNTQLVSAVPDHHQ